ncbi:nucleotidyltransferase family protein [Mangrovibacillus cuniculi]|uniref:Nucleotidyltransferase family protein n=1 Tax=Mangrovibacillus cuniculi TaxID=2593652 RepID=A0A7S8HF06_9BACI|nr:nucleotidyltransferase family protein [Mangrovibacillus cuniculi]QPC45905.1 nucleotidyltransferase family protein [Mangrovibacillus cuniculi]
MRNSGGIVSLIEKDQAMMDVLKAVKQLHLPDWWVCAGFIRTKVWDTLHRFPAPTILPDVDVVYFDPVNVNEDSEKELESQLYTLMPGIPWSVKNQARMHVVNNQAPYISTTDAISKFPETATAIGASLDVENNVILTVPWGVDDLWNMEIRPTPDFESGGELSAIYEKRLRDKCWEEKWPLVKVHMVVKSR